MTVVSASDHAPVQSPTAISRATLLLDGLDRDLRVLQKGSLTSDERKQRDRAKSLLQQARRLLRDAKATNEVNALSLATQASKEVSPLVARQLQLDQFILSAEQYRAGQLGKAVQTDAERVLSDLEPAVRYIEENRNRLGIEATPLAGATDKTLASACLLQTYIAFQSPTEAPTRLLAARRLLAAADAAKLPPRFSQRWYTLVAGHLQGQLQLIQDLLHAEDAVGRFPNDAEMLAVGGMFYEMVASPDIELPSETPDRAGDISDSLSAGGGSSGGSRVNTSGGGGAATSNVRIQPSNRSRDVVFERLVVAKRDGLARAENLYRKALAAQPDLAEAHLRLGRVLHLTGRGDAALQELQIAGASKDARIHYLATLFEGGVHRTAGRLDRAIACYEEAVRTCSTCLSGGVALSHAQRANGDPDTAARTLDDALTRDVSARFDDYWWNYALGAVWQRDALMAELRSAVR